MEALGELTVRHDGVFLSYGDACAIADRIAATRTQGPVCISLTQTTDATVGALARLALLRATLLKAGRDLYIIGLEGRAKAIYDIYRMDNLLPQAPAAGAAGAQSVGRPVFHGSAVCAPRPSGACCEGLCIEDAVGVPLHA